MKKLRLFDMWMEVMIGFGRGWLCGWTFIGLSFCAQQQVLNAFFAFIVMVCGIGLFAEVWAMLYWERQKTVRKLYGGPSAHP